jgi:hypothetical protein
MAEKGHSKKAKKSSHHRKAHHHENHEPTPVTINIPEPKESKIDKMVLENFISLQKVMTNLSIKLDDLTNQISKLLGIFEISAKALAEKDFDIERDNKALLEKMETLIDQNKILARGMTLVHERIPREIQQPIPQNYPPVSFSPPQTQLPPQRSPPPQPKPLEGFQPSITSSPPLYGGLKRMSKEISEEEEQDSAPVFEPPR